MKTAMTDLIEDVNIEKKLGYITENAANRILDYINNLYLEKEKEQIINAYDRGYKACDLDEALEINKTMFSGERYYKQTFNQTFNQNK